MFLKFFSGCFMWKYATAMRESQGLYYEVAVWRKRRVCYWYGT